MKRLACAFALLLLVGCGKSGSGLVADLNLFRNIASGLIPTTTSTAQTLNLNQLTSLLTNATGANGLTDAQKQSLADPKTQQLLQNLLQLAQGGSTNTQTKALNGLMGAAGGKLGNLGSVLNNLLTLVKDVTPIITVFDPAIAPYLAVATELIPLIQAFLGGGTATA